MLFILIHSQTDQGVRYQVTKRCIWPNIIEKPIHNKSETNFFSQILANKPKDPFGTSYNKLGLIKAKKAKTHSNIQKENKV